MASSSLPTPPPITIPEEGYDIFISFRGKDTRNNFTSHLHAALSQKQILSFIDSKHLRVGDEISASLFNAIEGSKLYLVIFSPNYASSKWCLLELEKILEYKNMKGKIVMPVFYKVKPSDVKYQTGSFTYALDKHEKREKMDIVQRWRDALNEACRLSGWHWPETRPESELIESIVNNIVEKLNKLSSTYSRGLVGIDSHVEKLKSLLCMESPSPNVCSVGIWGMGGIVEEMGWAIVREESINPENRSRLRDPEEICDVLTNKKGTRAIQSIILDLSKGRNMHLPIDAFVKMDNLQLLEVSGWGPKVHILDHANQHSSSRLRYLSGKAFKMLGWDRETHIVDHGLQFSSKKLRYLRWEAFPSKFFSPTLYMENLVKLSLPKGNFERVWTGAQIPEMSNPTKKSRVAGIALKFFQAGWIPNLFNGLIYLDV